jgi:hypothetical protein
MDAKDREPLARRSRGRSVCLLYNAVRPHSSIGYRPPAPETVIPRGGALAQPQHGVSRLRCPE